MKRITIQGIVEHEWFKQDLPEHLFPILGEIGTDQIDSSVIAEVCQKLSVPASDVMAAIKYVHTCKLNILNTAYISGILSDMTICRTSIEHIIIQKQNDDVMHSTLSLHHYIHKPMEFFQLSLPL